MAIAGIAAIAACICALEVPRMWRNRQWKELWLFGGLLALGIGVSVGLHLDADMPNPLDWLEAVFGPMGRFVEQTLGMRRVNEG